MTTSRFNETIIISVGGSLLIPDFIDTTFIQSLKDMVEHFVEKGYQIILVVGGGKSCRRYQAAAREFDHIDNLDLDWIGIKTIHLNCELIRRVFSDLDTHPKVILKPRDIAGVDSSVVIVGALLAASTGIVGATVVTMGLISLPTMLKRGYKTELATGVIASSDVCLNCPRASPSGSGPA